MCETWMAAAREPQCEIGALFHNVALLLVAGAIYLMDQRSDVARVHV